ncbi:MAG: ABC transporter ATP-binding protein [Alphaproteobacteria bacterium]|nr:MAG: ABC transporter ATP-binding protein [Alphaproteobacteria bacterium]
MTANLRIERVEISLGERRLIDLSATVAPGAVLTVMGPSGSGKSTLLAYIAGFLEPPFRAKGRIFIGEREITDLPANERRTGLLFQDPMLFPHMSVGDNLLFAIAAGGGHRQRRGIAEAALAEAGLDGFFDRDPATLSGGQAARTALMRVLVSQPQALLLDEPFSRLDADLRGQIRAFVFAEAVERRLPVLLVTHDEADARAAGGPVVVLE